MKTVAGLFGSSWGLRSINKRPTGEGADAAAGATGPWPTPRRGARFIGLAALSLALLPACDSLWRPYLDSQICDPSGARCITTGENRIRFVPGNGIDPAWFGEAQVELQPSQDLVIDTDQGTIIAADSKLPLSDVVYHQTTPADCGGGALVGIGVFSFLQIHIPDGIRVRVTGSRALALIAPGPIKIEGLLDLRGGLPECSDFRCGGPGGFAGGFVRMPAQRGEGPGAGTWGYGVGGDGSEAGGGGGGACGQGGKGGDAAPGNLGGVGGQPYLQPSLIPLCGGSGGGSGGPGTSTGDPGQRGGGGGGAVQLASQTAVVVGSSTSAPSGIQAGGGAGQGDHGMNFNDGGGGGGSGGAILIEAPRIRIAEGAVLAVNGGGGGGGFNGGALMDTKDGQPASLSSMPAAGGVGQRSGGAGGAGATLAGADASGMVADGGAGGGGGVGRIRLNSLDGNAAIAGELSPPVGECSGTGTITPL